MLGTSTVHGGRNKLKKFVSEKYIKTERLTVTHFVSHFRSINLKHMTEKSMLYRVYK